MSKIESYVIKSLFQIPMAKKETTEMVLGRASYLEHDVQEIRSTAYLKSSFSFKVGLSITLLLTLLVE